MKLKQVGLHAAKVGRAVTERRNTRREGGVAE
jgi:hypothetical protein